MTTEKSGQRYLFLTMSSLFDHELTEPLTALYIKTKQKTNRFQLYPKLLTLVSKVRLTA